MGHSHTFLDGSSGFVDYRPGQGMKLSRSDTGEEMTVKWTAMEKHLRVLVATDRYLTADEKREYSERQEAAELFTAQAELDVDNSSFESLLLSTDEPAQSPEYALDFRYVNDRLLVFNDAYYDPDEILLPPIIARVEPDGSVVFLDENLPEKERLEIERVAETKRVF